MCVVLTSPQNRQLGVCAVLTPPQKPPSRGMQASSSRFAPMSSARTPTRVGFSELMVDNTQRAKALSIHPQAGLHKVRSLTFCSQHRWWVRRPTTLERSDWRRAACPPAGRAQKKNWNLTPITKRAQKRKTARRPFSCGAKSFSAFCSPPPFAFARPGLRCPRSSRHRLSKTPGRVCRFS